MMSKFKFLIINFVLGFSSFIALGFLVLNHQPEENEITFVTEVDQERPIFTVLHIANFVYSAENGDTETVQKYVDLGIDVNSQDHNLDTALMGAILNGHSDIINILLQNDADPTLTNRDGYSTFDYSKIRDEPQLTATLVNHQSKLRQLSSLNVQEP